MKIQCACGAKYSFDITPEMARTPIQLICQTCGVDNSAAVNQVIQQQFGAPAPVVSIPGISSRPMMAPPPEIALPPAHARVATPAPAANTPIQIATPAASAASIPGTPPMAPPRPAAPALRVNAGSSARAPSASAAVPAAMCARHSDLPATQPCRVCEKLMCPKCMEAFGYVCSAYCKGKAENQGLDVPRYAGQRNAVQARQMRWIGWSVGGVSALFVIVMSVWGWYAWVGSVPKVKAFVRIAEPGHSGQLHIINGDQAVFLHGGHLIRHDFKTGNELWSHLLLDEQKIVRECKENYERQREARGKIISAGGEVNGRLGTLEELIDYTRRAAAAELHLHARGESVWVSSPGKVTRYEWQTGKTAQEITMPDGERQLVANGDELLIRSGTDSVTTLNLSSGEARTDRARPAEAAATRSSTSQVAKAGGATDSPTTAKPGGVRPKSTVERIVSPALTAVSNNQQRLVNEMRSAPSAAPAVPAVPAVKIAIDPNAPRLVVSRYGNFQLATKEIGQRTIGGESVFAYHATVRRIGAGQAAEWIGEVPGLPDLQALPSVTLIIAGKSIVALDQGGRKLWDARLDGGVRQASRDFFIPEDDLAVSGPCVERDGVVYICDGPGLMALEAQSGTVRWRFIAPAISGILFDGAGGIYANSIAAGGDKAIGVVNKVDSATGKSLWRIEREGAAAYASGKFVYVVDSYKGDDDSADGVEGMNTIFHVSPYLRIKRVDPGSGRILWHHFQPRFPLDAHFDKNTFQLLFKKEVQLLKFVSF